MFTTILIFLVTLGVLVFVHELGHFLAAKRSGVRVEEFGFGFPPRIMGWRKGETLYSINWIPVGGFVKVYGEDGENANVRGSFAALPKWRKLFILVSGVLMNLALAFVVFFALFVTGAPTVNDAGTPPPSGSHVRSLGIQVFDVAVDSPAAAAGIEAGDFIVSVDGQVLNSVIDLQTYNAAREGVEESVVVRRNRDERTVTVTPEIFSGSHDAVWGVSLGRVDVIRYDPLRSVWLAARQTALSLWSIVLGFGAVIRSVFVTHQLSADIAGPVGIAVLTGEVARLGFTYLLQFVAFLSLNLALVNALPFPALDGGRMLLVVYEAVTRRKVGQRFERNVNAIGYAVLLLLIVLITYRDIARLFS